MYAKLEEFRKGVESCGRKWDLFTACEIMGVDPTWFVDDRTLDLVKTYLFYRPSPWAAYPGGMGEQPNVWVQAKIVMDALLGTPQSPM